MKVVQTKKSQCLLGTKDLTVWKEKGIRKYDQYQNFQIGLIRHRVWVFNHVVGEK